MWESGGTSPQVLLIGMPHDLPLDCFQSLYNPPGPEDNGEKS